MSAVSYISDGDFCRNVICALGSCGTKDISRLMREKKLRKRPLSAGLSNQQLLYEYLDDYAEISGSSLRFFLFSTEEPPVPGYTSCDDEVISAINSLPAATKIALKKTIYPVFRNALFELPEDYTPSRRVLTMMTKRRGNNVPIEYAEQNREKFRYPLAEELKRLQVAHSGINFNFAADSFVDLAELFGVSVRWLMGSKRGYVFCDDASGEDLFDIYTLLGPRDQVDFCALLLRLTNTPYPKMYARVHGEKEVI